MLRLVTTICAAALVASAALAAAISGPAPDFSLQKRGGGQMSLDELDGQVVMINFWATWCVPCREEMPHLEALYKRYSSLGFTEHRNFRRPDDSSSGAHAGPRQS